MKKIAKLAAAVLLTFSFGLSTALAQAPEKMSYQAVIRDASNNLTTNQAVGMQISILQTSVTGTAVYVETQTPTTNANGLVSLEIGTGTVVSGDFTTIDWANGPYFIKTETDPTGGTTYTITGTTQLMSVPYALHAKTAESITGTVNYTETDPVFGASVANGITTADTANWYNHTVDTDTHIDSTGIAGLGYVAGGITTEVDGSVTNEIQDLQLSGNNLTITNNGTATTIDLSPYLDNTDTQLDSTDIANLGYVAGGITTEVDGSITNEIQDLQLSGNNLTITNNGTATTIDLSPYLDNTDTHIDSTGIAALGYVAGTTQVTAGTNVTITGTGTTASPYVVNATSSTGTHYLGEEFGGGVIYHLYIGSDGLQHGLIVNKNESTAVWQASLTTTNATRSWDGAYNTGLMTSSAAATYVNGLTDGGFTDWYLPSIDELRRLYANRDFANKALNAIGGVTLLSNTATYWSSTEYGGASYAFLFSFFNGSANGYAKNFTYSVRAVRAF